MKQVVPYDNLDRRLGGPIATELDSKRGKRIGQTVETVSSHHPLTKEMVTTKRKKKLTKSLPEVSVYFYIGRSIFVLTLGDCRGISIALGLNL